MAFRRRERTSFLWKTLENGKRRLEKHTFFGKRAGQKQTAICQECGNVRRHRHLSVGTCCGHQMLTINDKWRVPKKGDRKAWIKFEKVLKGWNPYYQERVNFKFLRK